MKKIILAGFAIVLVSLFLYKDKFFKATEKTSEPEITNKQSLLLRNKVSEDKLEILSTSPDPLEGAVILPTQEIEFKFNKQVSVSEFKHKFDPEVEHEVAAAYEKADNSTTMKIIFKKPLELGNGYTLFVLSNTTSEDNKSLDREFNYHFSTIKYRGV